MSSQLVTNAPVFDKESVRLAWLAALGAEPLAVKETVAGTTYSLSQEDYGKLLVFTSATAVTVTLPDDTTGEFEIPCRILLVQYGNGSVTVTPSGTTLNSISGDSGASTRTQYSLLALEKMDTDEWIAYGDILDSGTYTDGEW
jgi:penicillin V acylase-like amidase (Ntn superfamily)